MKHQEEIEQLVQQSLESLEGLQPATANDYLFSKIKNRLPQRQNQSALQGRLLLRLTAALLLFACINLTSIFLLDNYAKQGSRHTSGITAVSQQYFNQTDSYNY